jgi:carbon monoxide dehydrogenase subunit G
MEMTGERHLPATRANVWAALNDPEILQASIPGCRSLEAVGEGGFRATAAVRIGPIATSFSGEVRLLDLVPPESYRIEGSGQGGPAGFARGGAAVSLAEDGAGTVLSYRVKAEVGGKIAQLGARLIDASAKQMADQFFDNFARAVAVPETPGAAAPTTPRAPEAPAAIVALGAMPKELLGYPLIAWVAAAVFLFIAFNLLSGYL